MKLLRKLLIIMVVTSFFFLLFNSNTKINSDVKPKRYNHFNPVNAGEELVNNSNELTFDSFFLEDKDNDGVAEKYRGTEIENKKSEVLYINITTNGESTLKNATLTFDTKNATVSGVIPQNSLFEKSLNSSNYGTLNIKEVNNSINALFTVNITANIDKDLNKYNATNKVILKGDLVNNTTNEVTKFEKEVTYIVNSYSKRASTSFGINKSKYTENTYQVEYEVNVDETNNASPLYQTILEGSVTKLLGQSPVSVKVYPDGPDNYTYSYDPDTLTFRAEKKATIENGVITNTAYNTISYGIRNTKWHVIVVYPEVEEASGESVGLTVTAWQTGIKNKDVELFETSKVTTILTQELTNRTVVDPGFIDKSTFSFGELIDNQGTYFVDKTPIVNAYRGENPKNVLFNEKWHIESYLAKGYKAAALYENTGSYVGNRVYIDDYITYNKINIIPCNSNYYSNKAFKVIDADANKTIMIIKNTDYNKSITLPDNIHKIKLQSEVLDESSVICFNVYLTKEIETNNIINDFDENDFQYSNIASNLSTYQVFENGVVDQNDISHRETSTFTEKSSYVTLSTDKNVYEREISDYSIPVELTLSTNEVLKANLNNWDTGIFVVKIPEFIIDLENINVSSNNEIISKEKFTIANNQYIKIIFKADNNQTNVTVNFDAIINPTTPSMSSDFELYGYNSNSTVYINPVEDVLDINNDNNRTELVAHASHTMNLSVPNEVITGSTITGFSINNSIVVSPLTADVDPLRGSDEATIDVFILNNARNDISNLSILGRTGFIGNKYVVGSSNLGTEYNALMKSAIEIPDELSSVVNVYYSTNEVATSDLNNPANGWTQTPSNLQEIKSFLIDFDDDYIIEKGSRYDFAYKAKLPTDTEFLNKISYVIHGAYFDYITPSGVLPSSVSASKLGIRISRKYSADITLFKKYDNIPLSGGVFTLISDSGEERSVVINSSGNAHIDNLRVGENYTLVQKTPAYNSIINSDNVSFKINNGLNNELTLTNSGEYRSISFNGSDNLSIELENDVYYQLEIHSSDIDSNTPIENAVYKITGPNHEQGSIVRTNQDGWIRLQGLLINKVYKVEQIYADGYTASKPVEIKIIRDKNNHELYLTTRQKPSFTLSNCDDIFQYSNDPSNPYAPSLYSLKGTNSTAGTFVCNIDIDLSNYSSEYELKGTLIANDNWGIADESTVELSLTRGSDTTGLPPFVVLSNDNHLSGNSQIQKSFINDNVAYKENLIPSVDTFKGGYDYNLKVIYNRSSYNSSSTSLNPSMNINNIEINPKNGVLELAKNETKINLQSSDNANVSQSIFDYGTVPTVMLNVGNKKLEKRTFEITSTDSTTSNPISNAQFIISGYGLPDDGKILTTDENGKAEVELLLSFSGYYQNVPGISGNPDYPLSTEYTIKQVYAPTGYTVNTKEIKFKINANYPSVSSNAEYSFVYANKNKFDTEDITSTPVFKGSISSYPLFKVTKKDSENNNPLANTYYAIYKYDAETEELSPALDQFGQNIGEKLVINGTTYYVVKTDENGEISLPLVSGQYKLIEILASDDKYEIDNEEYIFSVGDAIPYQPAGAELTGGVMLPSAVQGTKNATVLPTDNNGYVVLSINSNNKVYLTKYDENDNVLWTTNIKLYNTNYLQNASVYLDKPGQIFYEDEAGPSESNLIQVLMLTEDDNSYYVYTYENSIIKVNKDNGEILYNIMEKSKPAYAFVYQKMEINDPNVCSDPKLIDGDNEHVYCITGARRYNHSVSIATFAFDSNSNGFIQIASAGPQEYFINENTGQEFHYEGLSVLKYDNNGYIIDAYSIDDKLTEGLNNFLSDNGIDSSHSYTISSISDLNSQVKYLEDDSVVILTETNISGLGKYTIAAKFDKNGNLVYFTPVGFNGNKVAIKSYGYSRLMKIFDDGSFIVYNNASILNTGSDPLLSGNDFKKEFASESVSPYSGMFVEFDKNGKLSNVIETMRYSRNSSAYETSNDYHRVNNTNDVLFIEKVNDGYIAAGPYQQSYSDSKLILASGEEISLVPSGNTYIVYKINNNSEVEWIREYNMASQLTNGYGYTSIINNKLYIVLSVTQKSLTNLFTNEVINAKNQENSSNTMITKYDIISESKPGVPTRINLNLLNSRKVYSVSINTNAGGSYKITKDSTVIYTGSTPDVVEHVKHGDNSLNEIVITPNPGFAIDTIKVNDNNASYKVNHDGSITLDQLNDIKENKVISVSFKEAESKVIVHHYLDGTTSRVASDVIITGNVNDDYITVPTLTRNYTLITDSNGNLVMPDNYQGKFTIEPIEVTYYYKEADAQLIVNFFLKNTDTQLAPSTEEQKPLGSSYRTSPLQINRYKLFSVLGNENGVLDRSLTEVSYYYDPVTQTKITTRYLDEDTNHEVANSNVEYVDNGSTYITYPLQTLPESYEYSYVDGIVSGQTDGTDIIVTYYYSKKKGKIVTRYISKDKQTDLLPPNVQYIKYGDTFNAKEPTITPTGYKLYSKPTKLSGIVDKNEIYLLYIYEKIEDPVIPSGDSNHDPITPSDNENNNIIPSIPEIDINNKDIINPKTSDNVGIYFTLLVVSASLLVATIIVDKKRSKRIS